MQENVQAMTEGVKHEISSYLIGGVLLGIALYLYLRLKQRGVLETKRIRRHIEMSRLLRSFPRK